MLCIAQNPNLPQADTTNLIKKDLVVGKGVAVQNYDEVTVDYSGTLTDGKKFDSSYDRHEPFKFIVGLGSVIKGWDLGLIGMKVGGKRSLVIPPELAYGKRAVGNGLIPANSTLDFTVEVHKIDHPMKRVKVTVVKAGSGPGAKPGDSLAVDYKGSLLNGTVFDDSAKHGEPLQLQLGRTGLIPGFTLGLIGMKKDEVRKIEIPADLAYGKEARGDIPANSVLVFELTLRSLESPK